VRRVLSNLVHNAIKFTEEGRVQVRVEAANTGAVISVVDTGIGIAPDFREHLFEPFKQESEGLARTHEGTGLGLALTKRMVGLLGGSIEVESAKEEGTTVVVHLPPTASPQAADETEVETEMT
jgi:signal transduction histidine kinase